MARPSKRDEVMAAAQRCFYAHGIAATGVDAIAAEAGVSKRTLYNHFPSKEDLLAHYIEWREDRWRARLERRLAATTDPVEAVLAYVDSYFEDEADGEYRGCAFINAAAELPSGAGAALDAIVASKARVRTEVADLLRGSGHPDPGRAATVITTLLEGACAVGGINRSTDDLPLVREEVAALARG